MNGERLDFMMMSDEFTSKIWKKFLAPDIILTGKPKKPFPHLYIANTAQHQPAENIGVFC